MAENEQLFDPYHRWLGIQPKDQPPNHYRLLGVDLFESDPEVIDDAAMQRTAHVRGYQLGPYVELSQRILNELASAKLCLLNPEKKAAYDAELRAQLHQRAPSLAPAAPPMLPQRHSGAMPIRRVPLALGLAAAGLVCAIGFSRYVASHRRATPHVAPHAVATAQSAMPVQSSSDAAPAKTSPVPSEPPAVEKPALPPAVIGAASVAAAPAAKPAIPVQQPAIAQGSVATVASPAPPDASAKPSGEKALDAKTAPADARPMVPLLTEGRFGRALIPPPAGSFAEAAVVRTRDARPEYGRLPLTVELWLKTQTNDQPWNLCAPAFLALALPHDPVWLVVRDESSIVAWWKLYDPRREQPDKSIQARVTDHAWHYLAVTCDQQSCDLFLDGARQGSGPLVSRRARHLAHPLWFGAYFSQLVRSTRSVNGAIDEVRLSDVVRPVSTVPSAPFQPDEHTIGLWHFDEYDPAQGFADASQLHNPAVLVNDASHFFDPVILSPRVAKAEPSSPAPAAPAPATVPAPAPTTVPVPATVPAAKPNPASLAAALRKKLHGKVLYVAKTEQFVLSYDWTSRQQLQDFDFGKAKLTSVRGKLLMVPAGESIRHVVEFSELTVKALVLVQQMRGTLLETSGGAHFSLGGQRPDTMYLGGGGRRLSKIVGKSQRKGIQPIEAVIAENHLAFLYGSGTPNQLGRAVSGFHAGQVELFGGDLGYEYGPVVFTGTIDPRWLQSQLAESAPPVQ